MKIKPSRLREIIQEEVSQFNSKMSAPPDDITGEPDEEGAMARSQLLKLAKYSDALMGMMNDNTQLPAWVQAKITKSASYLGAVKHFIEGEVELNEAVDGDPQSNTVSVERHRIERVVKAFAESEDICQAADIIGDLEDELLSELRDSIQALEQILMVNPQFEKISVERHRIERVVKAFDESEDICQAADIIDDLEIELLSELRDSIQALEQILMDNPMSDNAQADPEQQSETFSDLYPGQLRTNERGNIEVEVKDIADDIVSFDYRRDGSGRMVKNQKTGIESFKSAFPVKFNEEKQKMRKVTVEGKTYKIKK